MVEYSVKSSKLGDWLFYLSLMGLMLGFLCRYQVADSYYVRIIGGPIGLLLIYSNYVIALSLCGAAVGVLVARGKRFHFDGISLSLSFFLSFRCFLMLRRISVGFPMSTELVTFVLIATLAILFSQRTRGDGLGRNELTWMAGFMVAELAGYLVLNAYQDVVDPASVVNVGRFHGLNIHSNEFSMSLALLATWCYVGIFLGRFWLKALALIAIIGSAYYVYRAGSRSGALTFIVSGAPFLFWLVRRRPIWLIVFIGLLFFVTPLVWLYVEKGFTEVVESRLTSTTNTREDAFRYMWENFLNNPLAGDPANAGGTSNSFLYAASSSGIIGLSLLLIACVFFAGRTYGFLRLLRRFPVSDSTSILGPVVLSGAGALIVSSMFSGYLIETMQFPSFYAVFFVAYVERRYGYIRAMVGGRRRY